MAIAAAAVSTHFWIASVRIGVCIDTVVSAFEVFLPIAIVLLGCGTGTDFVDVDVDVLLDC